MNTGRYLFCTFFILFFYNGKANDQHVGKGKWAVLALERCPDHELLEMDLALTMSRISRSQVAFSGFMLLPEDLDESMSLRVDVCKYTDNECKDYQVLTDNSFCKFASEHAKNNFYDFIANMGIDPADCPMTAGNHSVTEYIVDYDQLPKEAVYGKFEALAHINKAPGLEFGCMKLVVEFTVKHDDEDDDDDEE